MNDPLTYPVTAGSSRPLHGAAIVQANPKEDAMFRTAHAAAAALLATLALTDAANALDIKAGSPG